MQNIGTNVNSISRQWPLSAHQKCWRAPSIIPISIFMKMSRLSHRGPTAQGFNAREPSSYTNAECETLKGSSEYPDTSSMLTLQCTILMLDGRVFLNEHYPSMPSCSCPQFAIHHLQMISCLICFVCMYGSNNTDTSALDPERPIVAAETRSRPYLVRVEAQPYFIISWFHAPASPDNLLNLQAPWCVEALIQAEDVRGQDARKSQDGWMDAEDDKETHLCNSLHLCFLLFFISTAHVLPQKPENGARFLNLEILERCETLKTTFRLKCPCG